MLKVALKFINGRGFTLIEMLAVMAIVAVLAGIVAVSVTGSGQTSRDTQVQEDANTAMSSVTQYFDDQGATEVFEAKTVDVLAKTDIEQETSNQWPENFITDAYDTAFEATTVGGTATNITATVNQITFLDSTGKTALIEDGDIPNEVRLFISSNNVGTEFTAGDDDGTTATLNSTTTSVTNVTIDLIDYNLDYSATDLKLTITLTSDSSSVGTLTLFTVQDLLEDFNALDVDTLDDGGYVTSGMDSGSATSTDNKYPNYLWLLEKDVAVGSTGTVNSGNMSVYLLLSVIESTTADKFNLVFQRLV